MLEPRIPNCPKGAQPPYLGPIIEPLNGAEVMDSSSTMSLAIVGGRLFALTPEQALSVHVAMFSVGITRNRFIAALAWVAQKRRKCDYATAWHTVLALRKPKLFHKLMAALTDGVLLHLWGGTDTEDLDSVGGFSTRELQFLANVTYLASREPAE